MDSAAPVPLLLAAPAGVFGAGFRGGVTIADDRMRLARVVTVALDPTSRGHAGGVNAMLMDGSVR
jgi:prepilin-type processing-associated H-X9-DG protein